MSTHRHLKRALALYAIVAATVLTARTGAAAQPAGTASHATHDAIVNDAMYQLAITFYGGTLPDFARHDLPSIASGPSPDLAHWMFPFAPAGHSDPRALARSLLQETTFLRSSAPDPWRTFFANLLANAVADAIISSPFRTDIIAAMVRQDDRCFAVVDAFGEQTHQLFPFAAEAPHAGVADECHLEVATTLPLSYLATDAGEYGDALVPMFLIPGYLRYVIQHELGHTIAYWLETTRVDGAERLGQLIAARYAEATRNGLHTSCYGSRSPGEYWADATALYLSPLAAASLGEGDGNEAVTGAPCASGLSPEAAAMAGSKGVGSVPGAHLILLMQPELYNLLESVYGSPPAYAPARRESR
ncbi:MAG: hypothetical protein HYV63_31520 [Candidatus Schekmanbacteria bacterium]|nr:hypothetical protein [Candidatus Schekmanbacteria bacterium]